MYTILNVCSHGSVNDIIDVFNKDLKNINTIYVNNIFDDNGNNCFLLACMYNNIDSIRCIIERKININMINYKNDNGFTLACAHNSDVSVIKYIAEVLNIDTHCVNSCGNNGFLNACMYNPNVNVIKYLIEQLTDINVLNKANMNGLTLAYMYNFNVNVIKYLIDCTDIKINTVTNNKYRLHELLEGNKNVKRINEFISKWPYPQEIKDINPLLLDLATLDDYKLLNPFIVQWNEYKTMVNNINQINESFMVNLTEPSYDNADDVLFENGGIIYKGNRKVILNHIIPLQYTMELDTKDVINLGHANLPEYIIPIWLNIISPPVYGLGSVKPEDFYNFISLVDMFPAVEHYNMKTIETEIIHYIKKYEINVTPQLHEIIDKYQLRHLYAYVHKKLYQ